MEGILSEGVVTSIVIAAIVGASVAYFLLVKSSPPKPEEIKKTPSPAIVKQAPPKPANKPRAIKEGTVPLKLLFGSQTGTAEEFSKTLAHEAKQYNFDPDVVDLEKYTIEELQSEKLVVFMTATYGDGEPTDNAKDFYQALMDPELPSDYYANVQFTVFGLGNKTYQHYNIVGRSIDKRMEELGAQRFFERGEGDDDGSLEQDFNTWKTKFWEHTSRAFNLSGVTEILLPDRTSKLEWIDQPVPASLEATNWENNGYDPKKPFLADVLVNKELHSANSDRSCRHIQLNISQLKYEPGDHVGVYPENSDTVVHEFAQIMRVEDQLDKVLVLTSLEEGKDKGKIVLGPLTLRSALKTTFDLTSAPRQTLLKQLLPYVTDPQEKEEFSFLIGSTPESQEKFNHWIRRDERVLAEVLAHFKSCKPPLDHLLEILPRLQPRYYSISSSLKAYPGELHLTSVVVTYVTPTGRKHHGVCSTYLTTLTPESGIRPRIFLRKSTFRLPKEPTVPIVMIGPGTGVAPFRGFIQDRKHSGVVDNTKNVLFFGSRRRDVDFIYQEELDSHEKENLLTLVLAFSRESSEKVYVQNKVYERKELILSYLDNVHIYICGDAKNMAKDVHNTLKKLIMENLNKSEDESEAFLKNLATSGRYMQDVW